MFLAVVGEVLLGPPFSKPCVTRESRSWANESMNDSADMAQQPDEMEQRDPLVAWRGCFVQSADEQFLEVA